MIIMATPSPALALALAPAPTPALLLVPCSPLNPQRNTRTSHVGFQRQQREKQHTSGLQNLILRKYGSLKATKDKLLDTTKRQKTTTTSARAKKAAEQRQRQKSRKQRQKSKNNKHAKPSSAHP
jgi:Skp family chaperone for outer membrane proteins